MKEIRLFYAPDAPESSLLSDEEARHAVRVLRLKEGDEIFLIDGVGSFYRASVLTAGSRQCAYSVVEKLPQERLWAGRIHLAIAPTKMMERMEWLVEKATEIGIDRITFLKCDQSERKVVKTERIEKIVVAAMKQSHKAWKPQVDELTDFDAFVKSVDPGSNRYIAHCIGEIGRVSLFDELRRNGSAGEVVVMVGPEGDFSEREVRLAVEAGFKSVHLGDSRLRTETAGLSSVMMFHLAGQ